MQVLLRSVRLEECNEFHYEAAIKHFTTLLSQFTLISHIGRIVDKPHASNLCIQIKQNCA